MVISFPSLTFVLQSYIPVMLQAAGSYLSGEDFRMEIKSESHPVE